MKKPEDALNRIDELLENMNDVWLSSNTFRYFKDHEELCLHKELDKMNPDMKGRPRGISCPCPKCSFRC